MSDLGQSVPGAASARAKALWQEGIWQDGGAARGLVGGVEQR